MDNSKLKKLIIRYSICIAVAAAMVLGVLFIRDFFSQTKIDQKFRFLSDGFFITGLLLILFSALLFVSDQGAFDGIGWALKSALRVIFPMVGVTKPETYKEYRERKHSKSRVKGYSCVFFTGLACILINIIFVILFNVVS
ncbi:MAG: DUF3899 domain-containing protein [Clostridia bacterium]|nr:DUF3899 domain-containing protein [Clostridia bacterium]